MRRRGPSGRARTCPAPSSASGPVPPTGWSLDADLVSVHDPGSDERYSTAPWSATARRSSASGAHETACRRSRRRVDRALGCHGRGPCDSAARGRAGDSALAAGRFDSERPYPLTACADVVVGGVDTSPLVFISVGMSSGGPRDRIGGGGRDHLIPSRHSVGQKTAVDDELSAGDERRIAARQERNRTGDLGCVMHAARAAFPGRHHRRVRSRSSVC